MIAMLGAMIDDNLKRDKPLSITWLWKPSYDYELTVWEAEDTAMSEGGISVLLGSRYPLEIHPVDLGKRARDYSETSKVAQEYLRKVKRGAAGKRSTVGANGARKKASKRKSAR
jgi:hypothetical protein